MEFDFNQLQDQLEETKRSNQFYTNGIEMLVKKYQMNVFFTLEELQGMYPRISTELLTKLANGEVPSEEEVLREDVEEIDNLVQHTLSLIGIGWGIDDLEQRKGIEPGIENYIRFLYECRDRDDLVVVTLMFGMATMALESPPSFNLVSRLAPTLDNEKVNASTALIFSEFAADLITKYVQETRGEAPTRCSKSIIPQVNK